nr:reverse transcriptase domain-containing protein [Tanacetum cinerariifolium]
MEFIVGTARQACLNAKVRMQTEYYLSVRRRLELECVNQANLLKVRDDEVEKLKAQLLLKETKATKAARLCPQVSSAMATEKMHVDEIEALKHWNVTRECKDYSHHSSTHASRAEVASIIRSAALSSDSDYVGIVRLDVMGSARIPRKELSMGSREAQLLLKETKATKAARLCPQVSSAMATEKMHVDEIEALKHWNVTRECKGSLDGKVMELDSLVSAKDLELEDLNVIMSPLKSQNDGLVDQSWLLSHDPKLKLVKCLNSSKCLMALGAAISRAIKHAMHIGLATRIDHDKEDASVEDIMSLLHLEGPLVDAPGMSDLHPEVELLWLPIHRSNYQVVLGETSLSFAVSVSHSHAKQIRADIAAKRSALMASIEATTALPTTFASASSIPPITIEDYEIAEHLSNTKVLTMKMDNPSRANTKQALGRGENKKADALSKITSTSFAHLRKQVLVKKLKEKSIDKKEVLAVVEEEGSTWMTLIYEYLMKEILPEKKRRQGSYAARQGNYTLREIHKGLCSMHVGLRSVVAKALRLGYYWPTMRADAKKLIRECHDC